MQQHVRFKFEVIKGQVLSTHSRSVLSVSVLGDCVCVSSAYVCGCVFVCVHVWHCVRACAAAYCATNAYNIHAMATR